MNRRRYPAGKLPADVLSRLIGAFPHTDSRLVVPPGIGEDAAVIDLGSESGRYLVAKTDPITFATDAIGWYAVHVNANDVAAMGATPKFFLAAVIAPAEEATPQLFEDIFASIRQATEQLGITVCGGHTEITHGIDRTIVVGHMLGEVDADKLVRSSGLRPGDALILTKGLAIEATAIIAREKQEELLQKGYERAFVEKCARFLSVPGISVVRDAQIATAAGAVTAMHDPTEGGVATGLAELAEASATGMEIDAGAMYIAPESEKLCSEYQLDPLGVLSSGALLIGCHDASTREIIEALREQGILANRIGTVLPASGGLVLRREAATEPLPRFPTDEITRIFVG